MYLQMHDKLIESLSEHKLTYLEWRTIKVIDSSALQTANRIAKKMNSTPTGILATANRLQMRGWLSSEMIGLPVGRRWSVTEKARLVLPAPAIFVCWVDQSKSVSSEKRHGASHEGIEHWA